MRNKEIEYALKLAAHMHEIFNDDSEHYIDKNELAEGDNANCFIHALATIMPKVFYQAMTEETPDLLEFNHIANRLCFQFLQQAED